MLPTAPELGKVYPPHVRPHTLNLLLHSTFFIYDSIYSYTDASNVANHSDTLKSNSSPSPKLRIWDSVVETRLRPLVLKR